MAQTLPAESAPRLVGLTDSDAHERLRHYGPNTLPSAHKATLFSIAFTTLKEPMLVLLLSTGVVYLLIGDLREAVAILASIFLVIGISVSQKQRTEKSMLHTGMAPQSLEYFRKFRPHRRRMILL